MSVYVASCRQCSSQTIIPHISLDKPPEHAAEVRFYCTHCGRAYSLEELMDLYIAL
jgi:hypothetical protein